MMPCFRQHQTGRKDHRQTERTDRCDPPDGGAESGDDHRDLVYEIRRFPARRRVRLLPAPNGSAQAANQRGQGQTCKPLSTPGLDEPQMRGEKLGDGWLLYPAQPPGHGERQGEQHEQARDKTSDEDAPDAKQSPGATAEQITAVVAQMPEGGGFRTAARRRAKGSRDPQPRRFAKPRLPRSFWRACACAAPSSGVSCAFAGAARLGARAKSASERLSAVFLDTLLDILQLGGVRPR